MPIERMTRTLATIATGRFNGRRSERVSRNGIESSSRSRIVGMPTVPRKTEAGHLKIRSR